MNLVRSKMSGTVFRRLLLPVLCAIGLIGAGEFAIDRFYHPGFWQKTTWLMHDPYRGELFDRAELSERLGHLEDSDPEVISVGDSSGFFSLQSKIVNRYTSGHKYLSLNTGANQAYVGYRAIAEYMLRRSKHIKYVVLYVYPQLVPTIEVLRVADLGPILDDDLVEPKSYITPPSAFLSPYAKFWGFEGRRFKAGAPLSNHVPLLQLWSTVDDSLGWLPEFDQRWDRINGRNQFFADARSGWLQALGLAEPSSINATLDDFDRMVRGYGAQLVVAFAPIAARILLPGDPNVAVADQALTRFQREHPDVKFLFPLLTRWGSEKFGTFNHVSREYTFLSSERLGKALGKLFADPGSIPPYAAGSIGSLPYPAISSKPLGPPEPDLLKPALALFLYASTGDDQYRQLLSHRVQTLLGAEPSYGYMMEDTMARAASLASRNIAIGFDLSQMRATPVAVDGLAHCNADPAVQWVQLDGKMIFTYRSPNAEGAEPVVWDSSSHIFIPTIVEDGVRKFDGYCPEPSLGGPRDGVAMSPHAATLAR